MSAHPFGPTPDADVERLHLFSLAVSSYVQARTDLVRYETVRSETDVDDPYLMALEITKLKASEVVKAQALTLIGHGVVERCIASLEARL